MRLSKLILVGLALACSTVFAVDAPVSVVSNNTFLIAQTDIRSKDSILDPSGRRGGDIGGSNDKSKRDQSNTSRVASSNVVEGGTQLCQGEFAFCASSTCKLTGRQIEVKEDGGKTTKKYPEVSCKCPIIDQKIAVEQNGVPLVGIAAVNEGNMNGSCTPPSPGTIWSYFSKNIKLYPQESATPTFSTPGPAQSQTCPANSGTGSNCWNYLCKIDPQLTNGVRTATCLCPIGEGLYGGKARNSADFVTFAGSYSSNPAAACSQYPVGYPKQLRQ